jgi:hypothetical protein
MNDETLLRLSKNPHYRMSASQRRRLEEITRPAMTAFGYDEIDTHDTSLPLHPVEIKRRRRYGKQAVRDSLPAQGSQQKEQ